jgi:hypothetical protein
MKWICAAAALLVCVLAASIHAQNSSPAFFTRSLDDPRDRSEARADILDTPVLPGSIVKTIALVARSSAASSRPIRRSVPPRRESRRPDIHVLSSGP